MSFTSLIGNDCMDIIQDFKTDLDNYQKQLDDITECAYNEFNGKYLNNPILLADFKEHYLNNNLSNPIKYQMKCYGNDRDNCFFRLDFNDVEDEVFEKTEIISMVKLEGNNTIYLEFAVYKFEEVENVIISDDDMETDNSYLITESDDESDIDFLMSLV